MTKRGKGRTVTTGYQPVEPDNETRAVEARRHKQRRSADLQLFATIIDARPVIRRYADDWSGGYSNTNSSFAGGVGGGTPSDPTLAALLRAGEGDGLAELALGVIDRINRLLGELVGLGADVRRLLPLEHPVALMLAKHGDARNIGAGACQACNIPVAGVGEDRLKSGWCPKHHREWLRRGRPDRARFNESIPDHAAVVSPEGGDGETAGPCVARADGVLLGVSGGVVRPADGSPYCEHVPPTLTDPDTFRCPECVPTVGAA